MSVWSSLCNYGSVILTHVDNNIIINVFPPYSVHWITCSGSGCWICLTLDVSLLQDGFTALYYASRYGHTDVVTLLLDQGADVNKVQHCNVSMQCSTTSQATMWIASSFLKMMNVTLNCSHSTGCTTAVVCSKSGGEPNHC